MPGPAKVEARTEFDDGNASIVETQNVPHIPLQPFRLNPNPEAQELWLRMQLSESDEDQAVVRFASRWAHAMEAEWQQDREVWTREHREFQRRFIQNPKDPSNTKPEIKTRTDYIRATRDACNQEDLSEELMRKAVDLLEKCWSLGRDLSARYTSVYGGKPNESLDFKYYKGPFGEAFIMFDPTAIYYPYWHPSVETTVRKMLEMAERTGMNVKTNVKTAFSEIIEVVVSPSGSLEEIMKQYFSELESKGAEWRNSLQGQAATKEQAARERMAEEAVKKPTATFTFADEGLWEEYVQKNDDNFGIGTIKFAALWAHLTEELIVSGETFQSAVVKAQEQALREFVGLVSGRAVSAATQMLVDVWVYGEDLRVWSNITISGEEGDPDRLLVLG